MTTIALIAASTFAMLVALFFAYQAGVARWPSGMPMDDPPPRV